MKFLILGTLVLFSVSVFGDSRKGNNSKHDDHKKHGKHYSDHRKTKYKHHYKHRHTPSSFDVVSLNSPVKDSVAKFLFKLPKNFEINQVMFKVKNASELFIKEKDYSPTKLVQGSKGPELHVPVTALKNGFYRLFVRVRTEEKAKPKNRYHDHDFKSAYHDYVRFVVEKKATGVQMPDPVANSATILGVDSDNDGIRDDIQLWIEAKSNQQNVKLALKQLAKAISNSFAHKDSKEMSNLATFESLRAQDCHRQVQLTLGTPPAEIKKIHNELDAMYLNTKDRIKANYKINDNFHGQTIEEFESETVCDF